MQEGCSRQWCIAATPPTHTHLVLPGLVVARTHAQAAPPQRQLPPVAAGHAQRLLLQRRAVGRAEELGQAVKVLCVCVCVCVCVHVCVGGERGRGL